MALKYSNHKATPETEEEFRALWRAVDGLSARKETIAQSPVVPPGTGGQVPKDIVRSWTFRLDSNATYSPNHSSQGHFDAGVIESPAFTHLQLWLALEKCDIAGLFYLLSVSVYAPIRRFNEAAGPDIPWTPPIVTPQGVRTRGKGSLYEFNLPAGPVTQLIDPDENRSGEWEKGDVAFFPIGLAGGATGARLLVTRSVSNSLPTAKSVCIRGYLTGNYIEHSEPPSNSWSCSSVLPAGA